MRHLLAGKDPLMIGLTSYTDQRGTTERRKRVVQHAIVEVATWIAWPCDHRNHLAVDLQAKSAAATKL